MTGKRLFICQRRIYFTFEVNGNYLWICQKTLPYQKQIKKKKKKKRKNKNEKKEQDSKKKLWHFDDISKA